MQATEHRCRRLIPMDCPTCNSTRGPHANHLATGRVTCGGDPVELHAAKRSTVGGGPWLPHDEQQLVAIAERRPS